MEYNKQEGKPINSSILLLGRFGFDGDKLEKSGLFEYIDRGSKIKSVKYPKLDITFMTAHASKGLGYDNVIVVNGRNETYGFPSKIEDDPVLAFVIKGDRSIDYAEERRLFYVAMTRAKKILQLSFASSRLRNGKTESNSPSRFIREVDRKYISNPLEPKDDDRDDDKPSSSFSWGRPAGSRNRFGQGGYSYGTSGPVKTEKSRPAPVARPVRPSAPSPVPVSRTQVVPKRVSDAEFEPTPILQLKAGQRIEHNRFGFGQILEITGQVPDLKAS
jgi:hypothetical protein